MAGLGKKTFEANEVLTAADVNGYLMDQSVMRFATTSSRDTNIPSPTEGMVVYIDADNTLLYYTGAAWESIANALGSIPATDLSYTVVSEAGTAVTLTSTEANKYLRLTSDDTVLTVSTATDFATGDQVSVLADGTALTITTDGATLAGAGTSTTAGTFTVGAQYEAVSILCVDTDAYRVIGNSTAE